MIKVKLSGVKEANAAFRALPPALKEEHNETTLRTVKRVRTLAQSYVPSRLGNLRKAIDFKFTPSTGTGIVGVRKGPVFVVNQRFLRTGQAGHLTTKHPDFYGQLVHNGSIHNPNPVPFMLLAAEGARDTFIAECKSATDGVIDKLSSSSGSRFL